MSLVLNPQDDWQVMDNLETATLFPRTNSDVSPTTGGLTVPNVLRRAQGKSLSDYMQTNNLTFHLWSNQIPGAYIPKVNDVIQDSAGIRWTILRVDYATWTTRYRLDTLKEPTSSNP